jgi:hypothetical protein
MENMYYDNNTIDYIDSLVTKFAQSYTELIKIGGENYILDAALQSYVDFIYKRKIGEICQIPIEVISDELLRYIQSGTQYEKLIENGRLALFRRSYTDDEIRSIVSMKLNGNYDNMSAYSSYQNMQTDGSQYNSQVNENQYNMPMNDHQVNNQGYESQTQVDTYEAQNQFVSNDGEEQISNQDYLQDIPVTDDTQNMVTADYTENIPVTDDTQNIVTADYTENIPETDDTQNMVTADYTENIPVTDDTQNMVTADYTENIPVTDDTQNMVTADYTEEIPATEVPNQEPSEPEVELLDEGVNLPSNEELTQINSNDLVINNYDNSVGLIANTDNKVNELINKYSNTPAEIYLQSTINDLYKNALSQLTGIEKESIQDFVCERIEAGISENTTDENGNTISIRRPLTDEEATLITLNINHLSEEEVEKLLGDEPTQEDVGLSI